jgi:peptidoglycan/xylan/chitin deacetylase (PgdA/CDA1 family)
MITVLVFTAAICLGLYVYNLYSLPVLSYHSIADKLSSDYPVVYRDIFSAHLTCIKKWKYNTISFDQYCEALICKKRIMRNTIVLTFDDGREDNLYAAEMLRDRGMSATFFISPGLIGKPGFLSLDAIKRIAGFPGMTIGSHTVNHVYLPDVDNETLQKEIEVSKRQLEQILERPVLTLCYPLGGFDRRALSAVEKAGYLGACTTNRGFSRSFDRFAMRRIKINNKDMGFFFWRKLSGYYPIFNNLRRPG